MRLLDVLVSGFLADTLILQAVLVLGGSLLLRRGLAESAGRTAAVTLSWLGCLLGLGALAEALAAFDALLGELLARSFPGTSVAGLNPVMSAEGDYAHAQMLALLVAVLTNLAWARFSRARILFFNPLHLLLATAVLLALFAQVGAPVALAWLVVGVTVGSAAAWLPHLGRKRLGLAGEGYALGTFNTLALGAGRWLAEKSGARGSGAEAEQERGELLSSDMRRSPILFAALLIGGIAALLSLSAGADTTATILQGTSLLHMLPAAGATFSAVGGLLVGFEAALGLWVLLLCLPRVSAALVDAFGGLRRVIPELEPALDAVFLLPGAPQAVVPGFLVALLGGTVGYYAAGWCGLAPVVPGVLSAITGGGALGVIAQRAGGRRGLVLATFLYGLGLSLLASGIMTASSALGAGVSVELSDVGLAGMLLALLLLPFK